VRTHPSDEHLLSLFFAMGAADDWTQLVTSTAVRRIIACAWTPSPSAPAPACWHNFRQLPESASPDGASAAPSGERHLNKLREIECFIAVAEPGSFVKAADALGISKAAVSRTVLELEARLGSRLMQRTTRRLSSPKPAALPGTLQADRRRWKKPMTCSRQARPNPPAYCASMPR
jgi:hypothetical protein